MATIYDVAKLAGVSPKTVSRVLNNDAPVRPTTRKAVEQAIAELGISAAIVKEEDIAEILSYGIMTLPGLVVDGRVVSAGRKLSLAEVKELLNR